MDGFRATSFSSLSSSLTLPLLSESLLSNSVNGIVDFLLLFLFCVFGYDDEFFADDGLDYAGLEPTVASSSSES